VADTDFIRGRSATAAGLLTGGDPSPVGEERPQGRSPFVILCDHAGNAVPRALGRLGLPDAELNRHIGIDIGALAIAREMSARLDAPLVYQRYSRLVIDANRRPHAADSIAPVSDGTVVPGNQDLPASARELRIREILNPYHDRIARLLDDRQARGLATVLVAMHSFTPRLRARPADRPWQVGVIWGEDDRFAREVLAELRRVPDLEVGANEPYRVDMANDYSLPVHAEGRRLPYVEFEVRQDLAGEPGAAGRWAERLCRGLEAALPRFRAAHASD